MTRKILILLFLITFLGGLLRFRDITTNPPNLNTDEAAIGYNAYSILKTGRDEYGQFLPLAFRSFDDYKPPLYIYLTVPSVAVFGLNEFAVRFPSALLGVLAIITTYFLTKKLLGHWVTGLLAAFLLAISPWHIQFTRTAYETGSNTFFTSLGLLLFLKGLQKKWYWILAGIVFGLQMYLYQASKVFVPLFVFCLLAIYFRKVAWRQFFFFLAPFVLLLFPLGVQTLSSTGMLRIQGTSIFHDPKSVDRRADYLHVDWLRNDNKSVLLFHPEQIVYSQDILVGYLSHFRPDFLLASRNDPKVTYVPEAGLIPLWTFPFLLAGFYCLFRQKNKIPVLILTSWVLISPIPASITTGVPSAIRTAIFLPSWQIITAFGLVCFYSEIRKSHSRLVPAIVGANILLAVWFFSFYTHMLFIHSPVVYAQNWYSNYKKFVKDSLLISGKYQKIVVSTILDQPQIFYLFYSQYDPATYLKEGGTTSGGFSEQNNHLAGKYYFHSVNWFEEEPTAGTLLVATPRETPPECKDDIIARYYSLDGKPLVNFIETR